MRRSESEIKERKGGIEKEVVPRNSKSLLYSSKN
jgi:hypothetical protein